MCGIVGYAGSRDATSVLMSGLRRLEYRGYDSAGVAVLVGKHTQVVGCEGKLAALENLLAETPPKGTLGKLIRQHQPLRLDAGLFGNQGAGFIGVLRLQGRVRSHDVFLLGQEPEVLLRGQTQLDILE